VEEGDEGDPCPARMASVVVRAAPRDVLALLLADWGPHPAAPHLPLRGARTVGSPDAQTDEIRGSLPAPASGAAWALGAAPREEAFTRTWRQEAESGAFVVTLTARGGGGAAAGPPVSVGYSVAPRRDARGPGALLGLAPAADECLVTMVARVDAAGLPTAVPLPWLLCLRGPAARALQRAAAEAALLTLLSLRDVAEARRFALLPFDAGPGAAADPGPAPAAPPADPATAGPPAARARRPGARGAARGAGAASGAADGDGRDYTLRSSVPAGMWKDPRDLPWRVRGPSYLGDRVKVPGAPPAMRLLGVELLRPGDGGGVHHVSRFLPGVQEAPFDGMFVLNMAVPGLQVVCVWAPDGPAAAALGPGTPAGRCWARFVRGDPAHRDRRFKLIPSLPNASWVVKQAVGSSPVLLGRKIRCLWYR